MEGIERTNAVIVRGSGAGAGQNMGRRVEYGDGRIEEINNHKDNLKGVENLEFLD